MEADRLVWLPMHWVFCGLCDRQFALSVSAAFPSDRPAFLCFGASHFHVSFVLFSYNRNRLACIYFSILFMAVNKSVDSLNEKSHFKESSLFRRYRSFAIVWLVLSILLSVWYSSLLLNLFAVSLSLLWMCAS